MKFHLVTELYTGRQLIWKPLSVQVLVAELVAADCVDSAGIIDRHSSVRGSVGLIADRSAPDEALFPGLWMVEVSSNHTLQIALRCSPNAVLKLAQKNQSCEL